MLVSAVSLVKTIWYEILSVYVIFLIEVNVLQLRGLFDG